jgi:hypothetical protein
MKYADKWHENCMISQSGVHFTNFADNMHEALNKARRNSKANSLIRG